MLPVHASMSHQGIATAVANYLCCIAQKFCLDILTITSVSKHQYAQKLAKLLRFTSTALLRDYCSSPFERDERESTILGVLPLQPYPILFMLLN